MCELRYDPEILGSGSISYVDVSETKYGDTLGYDNSSSSSSYLSQLQYNKYIPLHQSTFSWINAYIWLMVLKIQLLGRAFEVNEAWWWGDLEK